MKLLYLTNSRLPTEKAHGIQIMSMCEAFARAGAEVTLVVPGRRNEITQDPFLYYGIQSNFKIQYVGTIDTVFLGRAGFIFQSITFACSALRTVWARKPDVIYSRDEYALLLACVFARGKKIYEAHTGRWNSIIRAVAKRVAHVIVISNGLKSFFIEKGIAEKKIIISPDAVDYTKFAISILADEARRKLGLPFDKKIILYTGHLYSWKGADLLLELARKLPETMLLVVVGGFACDIELNRARAKGIDTIVYLGQKPHQEMPLYLQAADVLIIPNSGVEKISREYTSPMKLFEYMASARPIVVSDLPSMREILTDDAAFFALPDDANSFFDACIAALSNSAEANNRAQKALQIVCQKYTWDMRARTLLSLFD